jgi:hypothetical protein
MITVTVQFQATPEFLKSIERKYGCTGQRACEMAVRDELSFSAHRFGRVNIIGDDDHEANTGLIGTQAGNGACSWEYSGSAKVADFA